MIVDIKHRAIIAVTQTHFRDNGITMSSCFIYFFSPVYSVIDTCAGLRHHTNDICRKLPSSVFSKDRAT